jgi:hypothetical protein
MHGVTSSRSAMVIGHHERFAKIWQAFSEPLPTYKTCSTTFVTSHESRRATRAIP